MNNSLNQLIAEPTHSNGNILDLLLCNYFSSNILISYCIDMPFCSSCDHSSIHFHLKWTVKNITTKPKCHNFKKANYKVICEVLSCINWNSVLESSGDCVQTLYDHILEILSHTIQFYVPLEFSSESIRKPSQLSKLLKEKLSLYQKGKNDFSLVSDYKAKSKEYDQCVKKCYTDVETSICNNLNNAKFYGYINKKMNVGTCIPILKSEDGHLVSTDEDKAMLFNSVFQKVFTVDNDVNLHLNSHLSYHKHLQDFEITTLDVIKALNKLKSFMSWSPDNIQGVKKVPDRFLNLM